MVITLTPEIEQALAEQACRQGTTPEHLALESLRKQFVLPATDEPPAEAPATLADFLGSSIGVLHSSKHIAGGARMSEAPGETFAKGLVEKRQQAHL